MRSPVSVVATGLLLPLLLGCDSVFGCDDMRRTMSFEANLTPEQVVPAVSDTAVGFAELQLAEEQSGSRRHVVAYVVGWERGGDYGNSFTAS